MSRGGFEIHRFCGARRENNSAALTSAAAAPAAALSRRFTTMSLLKRLPAVAAATTMLAIAAPVATAGAALPSILPPRQPAADICFSGFVDPGPFGPSGPYGADGPYGPDGPLAGRPNPLGNTAECGGLLTFVLRGGTISSYVNANLASVGITP
jgi:hypothetical protein